MPVNKKMIYLDTAAGTLVDPRVRRVLTGCQAKIFGNAPRVDLAGRHTLNR